MKLLRFLEPAVHVLLWLGFYLVAITMVRTLGPFHKDDHTILLPVTFGFSTSICLFYLISGWIIPKYRFSGTLLLFVGQVVAVLLVITVVDLAGDLMFFKVYYSTGNEGVFGQLLTNLGVNLVVVSLGLGYGLTRMALANERQRKLLVEEKLRAELNFLKAQVNPHTLFNMLNLAFASASRSGDEQTADIIGKIASLMRYMLHDSRSDTVGLEREMAYINDFIALQKLRISPDVPVSVSFEYDGNTGSFRLAPLLLIPFVENAFKHGISLHQPASIMIRLVVEGSLLRFSVVNQVFHTSVKNNQTADSGIGLENVRKRLNILYPGSHTLDTGIENNQFVVSLTLNNSI